LIISNFSVLFNSVKRFAQNFYSEIKFFRLIAEIAKTTKPTSTMKRFGHPQINIINDKDTPSNAKSFLVLKLILVYQNLFAISRAMFELESLNRSFRASFSETSVLILPE
jgi:NAD-specific glutamate dehydrogenase